ncbi:DUF881 domain-containing protein [Bifidobacterium samirii]|uniref:DUF881 domain-containing protein n=1 Tax=Bifidobacterium samirii TaxID=2306974 RepID=A0A430FVA2_9BIFI|nr:DUF881 domain-containing protein [Bifidobacterium samirii]RSX57410.1 hypothetical protein D2E24_0708 [Bifidobacterium samirii]
MARRTGRHAAKRSLFNGVAVFLLVAFTGFLLATNARLNRTAVVSSDTADLVEQRVNRVTQLQDEIGRLGAQVNTLKDLASDVSDPSGGEDAGSGTTLPAVEGPGLTVTLDDSPLWESKVDGSGSAANINDYVVHQQDVEAVVNALWAGGAESMMIQDQRVLFNSAVICQGNVLLLQGRKYSPPYTIKAIGPIDGMKQALDDSKDVRIYREYVSAFGLGWKVEENDRLEFPESAALLQSLQYSSVIDDEGENAQ